MTLIPAGANPIPFLLPRDPASSSACSLPHCSPGYKTRSLGVVSWFPLCLPPPICHMGVHTILHPLRVDLGEPPGECSHGQASEGDRQ